MTNFIEFTDGGEDPAARPYIWQRAKRLHAYDMCDLYALELSCIAEGLAAARECMRGMIGTYRQWKLGYEHETDGFEKVHRAYEGIFVRRQFAEAWRLYSAARRDYHELRCASAFEEHLYRRAA